MFRLRQNPTSRRLAVALAGLVLGMASCSTEPPAQQSTAEVADQITQHLALAPEPAGCVRTALDRQPELASAFNTGDSASSEQRQQDLLAALRPCLPASLVADAYVRVAAPSGAVTDEQRACLRAAVIDADGPTSDSLLANGIGAPFVDDGVLTAFVGRVSERCHLAPSPDTPGTGAIDGGPVTITR